MKVQRPPMGVSGWYECLAASWLADMRSKQVPTSTTSARRLAALNRPLASGAPQNKAPEEEEDRGGSPLGPGGPFTCSQCRGAYPTREQLERHETLHSPNTQTCKICHKSFANVYRLQRHMISHDDNATLRKFKCNDCDKAFKFKHHLKEHLRIHSGEKPFECANCGKKFSHSGSYSSHMTSKKCLVMNLKMGRIKPNNPALNPDRSPSRKRANAIASQLNNNIAPNGSSFLPILPKYNVNDAAAFFASISSQENNYHRPPLSQPGIPPFYMHSGVPISPASGITPYTFPASLSQFFEQLTSSQYQQRKLEDRISPKQSSSPPPASNPEDMIEEVTEEEDKHSEGSADLVMDVEDEEVSIKQEHIDRQHALRTPTRICESLPLNRNGSENRNNTGFNSILETVSASVTKHFFRTNMEKLSPVSGNICIAELPPAKIKEEIDDLFRCSKCDITFTNNDDLLEHEKVFCANMFRKHEGLAAQMAETVALNRLEAEMKASIQSGVSASDDEEFSRDGKISIHDKDRKFRVRTALSEEQQVILKEHYSHNPRPNREESKRIAERIGLDHRVVQVWFQNNRARIRRMTQTLSISDQPLDLSTKKSDPSITPSPSPSPTCSISVTHSDYEEAVNLSQKSSRSTTPHHSNYINTYPHSNCSSSSFNDFRLSPSPGDQINGHKRILSQKMPISPIIPMDKLLQYNDITNARSPLINMPMSTDISRQASSPVYDRPAWCDDLQHGNDLEDDASVLKKNKLKTEFKEGEGQFVCDQCEKTFVKQSSLARHKYEHSGQRPYKCMECPKAFKHKHHLTEHKRLHTGEKPFQCRKCLKKFSHSGSYSQHMNHRFAICKPYRD